MKKASPDARIIIMNPVERGDFVYILDADNSAPSSAKPQNGIYLRNLAALILEAAEHAGVDALDLNRLSGFTTANAVKFKHVRVGSEYRDLPGRNMMVYLSIRFTMNIRTRRRRLT